MAGVVMAGVDIPIAGGAKANAARNGGESAATNTEKVAMQH